MPGKILGGRYTIQDKIGTGGMAIVYRGLDTVLGRTVAIKTMLPQYASDPSFAARFKQEAQAAAALQSPYIVAVYDWGKDGDTYYIVMEYLRGSDLKSGIRKHGALDGRKVAQIGSQIAQALSVAHRHDIIHRDIKPQNIMVQPDGNIKVMDFGIARAKNSHLTTDNSVLGTAHYVSPEQTQGKPLSATSDIYSLGIVMYEAATGKVPFDGDDAISVALKQVNEQPLPPSQLNPSIDAALESIILKCMQKNPRNRFQSADELYRTLRDYLAGRLSNVNSATALLPASKTKVLPARSAAKGGSTTVMPRPQTRTSTGSRDMSTAIDMPPQRSHKGRNAALIIGALLLLGVAIFMGWSFMSSNDTQPVPNFLGLTKDEAVQQLEESDFFDVGTIKEEYSDSVEEGKVLDQDPDSGKKMPKNTKVNLVISKGKEPAKEVTVPDLRGKTPDEVNQILSELGLIGQASDSIPDSTIPSGAVASQDPAAGTTIKAGDTVTYQLSSGPEEAPNVVGQYKSDAENALLNAGYQVIERYQASSSYASGLVIDQQQTGSMTITITISTGPSQPTNQGTTDAGDTGTDGQTTTNDMAN